MLRNPRDEESFCSCWACQPSHDLYNNNEDFICHSSTHPYSPVFKHFQRQHLCYFLFRKSAHPDNIGSPRSVRKQRQILNYISGYTMIHICISVLYIGSLWYTYNYAYLLACCEWWIVRLPLNNYFVYGINN